MKNKTQITKNIWKPILLITLSITCLNISCDTSKLKETPIDNFIGTWKLHGRSMFDGIKIKISKNESGQLIGTVVQLNQNKYIQLFLELNDTWVASVKQNSNYEFTFIE